MENKKIIISIVCLMLAAIAIVALLQLLPSLSVPSGGSEVISSEISSTTSEIIQNLDIENIIPEVDATFF